MQTTVINTIEAKEQFTDLVNRVAHGKERIILSRRGKEIAVIVSLEDYKFIQESQNKSDLEEAIDALKEAREMGTITLHKLKETIG